ncbi:MAG TPA: adenosylcobinamide-phosphate synthase CbiB [Bryobacteraceae bacterium]|jgi:adenosylcobinamide-phosphate synthase|nr:adenosylcobinamide-phosphate synthase CbiB [Bryobacteraceae bacterium]
MMVTPGQLCGGVAADLLLGDPRWLPHPVAAIGKCASWMERLWRWTGLPARIGGVGAWCCVIAAACGVVWATLVVLPAPYVQIYWIFSFLAVRSLDDHARAVVRALRVHDLAAARASVGLMVGRDTDRMDEHEVARAMIESVAENLSDGVIAPLFWLVAGGPIGMAAYKAVNTLDSMFGYKNERYKEFGWCSARMDDVANFIPARLTAGLIWLLALLLPGLRFRDSVRATMQDAHRQPSPNSGYPEAAAAGALGVQLGGTSYYRGVRAEKAHLGFDVHAPSSAVYGPLRVLLYAAPLLLCGLAVGGMQCL